MGEACTIVLRGATQQILDEADRSMHDALCVLSQTVKETRTVYGGGKCYLNTISTHQIKCYSAIDFRYKFKQMVLRIG